MNKAKISILNYFKNKSHSKSKSKSSESFEFHLSSKPSSGSGSGQNGDRRKWLDDTLDEVSASFSVLNTEGANEIILKDDDPGINDNPVYVNQKPCQPIIEFPTSIQNGVRRKFNKTFYDKYNWLEYSVKKDAIYCFTCRHFNHVHKHNKNDAFITGIRDLKNASRNLKSHNLSERHRTTYEHWFNRITNKQNVASKISSQYEKEVALNRQNSTKIINAADFLAKQVLPFRGHFENDENRNNGNFLELLNLFSANDCELKKHLESKTKYTCHESQNQFISLIAQEIKNHIINSIDDFYSIIVDETMDVSKLEQISLIAIIWM